MCTIGLFWWKMLLCLKLFDYVWNCLWNYLKIFEIIRNCLKLFEISWNSLKLFKIVWYSLKLLQIVKNCLKLFENIWDVLKFFEFVWNLCIWMKLCNIFWSCWILIEIVRNSQNYVLDQQLTKSTSLYFRQYSRCWLLLRAYKNKMIDVAC